MAFAPIDLFASIITSFATRSGSLDALTVNHAGTWICRATALTAIQLPQGGVKPLPGAIQTPFTVAIIDTIVVRIFFRQVLPLAASAAHIETGIHHPAHIQFNRTAWSQMLQRQQGFKILV
jgi:hypothetical protein